MTGAGKTRAFRAVLATTFVVSFILKLHHLDHPSVKPLDEVFHALVARNFLKHPFTPTLVEQPFLKINRDDWLSNHIWLHKPPMALWQIAVSFALLGVNTLALRLPSAILSTLAALLTYLIGAELLDRTVGFIAATLQAFNPVILMLVHGYVFSDHVDISLLFWTELSIYFLVRALRTGHSRDLIPCGMAQGLAFLSKTFPSLIVTGVALVVWLLPRTRLIGKSEPRLSGRGVRTILLSTLITIAPWLVWTAIRFPHEFAHEYLEILHHLDENIEQWAAPWDQVIFYFWISIFHVFYPAILAAAGFFLLRACQQKQTNLWLIIAWGLGVLVPNLLATSKPMSATLIGWPALWLMLGYVISRAFAGDRFALGTWVASMLLAIIFLNGSSIPVGGEGFGHFTGESGEVMRKHLWVIFHGMIAIFAGGIFAVFPFSRKWNRVLLGIASAAMIFLTLRFWKGDHPLGYGVVAWKVTEIHQDEPDLTGMSEFAAHLPANAAFLVEENRRLENKVVEFASDRSCYAANSTNWRKLADDLQKAGAIPFLVTTAQEPLPLVHADLNSPLRVYACSADVVLSAPVH